jgi:uncharacterized protein with GYD domain
LDSREQQAGLTPGERTIKIGGQDWGEKTVLDAIADKAATDSRNLTLPQSPDAYEIALPADFKLPPNVSFEFNKDDPAFKEARAAAHAMKLDQGGFSKLLGIYAAKQIAEVQTMTNARNAEIAKLGSAATTRVDAVTQWLGAKFGDKARIMADTLGQYPVAANVEVLEDIIKLVSSQGGGSLTQTGREGEEPKGTIPNYSTMTFEQRRAAQQARDPAYRGTSWSGKS